MATTEIEWATDVWNPTTGCDRVSDGCDNCYALTMAKRLKGMGSAKYQTDGDPKTSGPGFGAAMHPDALELPLSWTKKPRRVFVNSMSDLFHEKFTDEFIAQVFAVMAACPQHTFQILTKRHARMRSLLNSFLTDRLVSAVSWDMGLGVVRDDQWPLRNVWMGVSTEDQKWADIRIPALLDTPAAVRWISAEPLLGPIALRAAWVPGKPGPHSVDDMVGMLRWDDATRLDWVVVGGESGRQARPMHPSWARSLRDQCAVARVPFLFKQWGEWGLVPRVDATGRYVWKTPTVTVADDGTVYKPGDLAYPDGPRYGEAVRANHNHAHLTGMYRVGKKVSGRELDDQTHDGYPIAS